MLSTVPGCSPSDLLTVKLAKMVDEIGGYVRLRAREGWGGAWWLIFADGVYSDPFTVESTGETRVEFAINPLWDSHVVYAIPLGRWSYIPAGARLDLIRNYFETDIGTAVEIEWDSTPDIAANFDSDQFSAWALVGLRRFDNCYPVVEWPTRARCDLVLTTTAGVHALELYARGDLVALGSRIGNGSIILSPLNGSGISGTVTLTYSGDLTEDAGAYIEARWPMEWSVYDGDTLVGSKADNGMSNRYAQRCDGLSSGQHSIRMKLSTDVGQDSGYGSSVSVTIPYRPPDPGAVEYVSGGAAGTVIQFAGSTPSWIADTPYDIRKWVTPAAGLNGYSYECTTAGTTGSEEPSWPIVLGDTVTDGTCVWTCRGAVTYLVYDSVLNYPTNLTSVSRTAGASATTVQVTLVAIAPAAGVRHIMVFSTVGGLEDPHGQSLELEYQSDGSVVNLAPNVPTWAVQDISGRTLTVAYQYDGFEQGSTPVSIVAWLVAEGVTPNYAIPDVTEAIATVGDYADYAGSFSISAPADGFFRLIVRAKDADGSLSSNTTLDDPVWIGTGVPAVPTPSAVLAV